MINTLQKALLFTTIFFFFIIISVCIIALDIECGLTIMVFDECITLGQLYGFTK